jgi:hypothetical protein
VKKDLVVDICRERASDIEEVLLDRSNDKGSADVLANNGLLQGRSRNL